MLLQGRTILLPLAVLASYSHTVAGAKAQCRTYTTTVLIPASSCSVSAATNTGMSTVSPVSVQSSSVAASSAPAASQLATPAVSFTPKVGDESDGKGNKGEPVSNTTATPPSPTPEGPSNSAELVAVQQTSDTATPTSAHEVATPPVTTPLPSGERGASGGEEGQSGDGEGGGKDGTAGTGPGKPNEPGLPPPPPPSTGNSGGPAESGNPNELLNPSMTLSPPSRTGSNNSADSSAPAATGTDSKPPPGAPGEANKSFVTLIEPWTGIVRTISKPTTIAKISGSGTAPGTIVIATPAVFVTTTSKGAAGTTTVPPSGTAPGIVVVGA